MQDCGWGLTGPRGYPSERSSRGARSAKLLGFAVRALSSASMLSLMCGAAQAQQAPAAAQVATTPAPSENAMVNLIRALEAQGVLSPDKGDALLRQAENEAAAARTSAAAAGAAPPGTVRVPYVPESVRAQIRDELKDDVIQQAKAEGWASPGTGRVQSWVSNVRLFGDFRYRAQFNYFGRGNDNQVFDFNAINANGPTELNPAQSGFAPPLLNTTRDRNNLENIRLRFGIAAKVNDWVDLTVRLAGGDTNSPVSTSSTLGGGFVKKSIYIDQAYAVVHPIADASLIGGRMPNPFYSYDVIWDPDLNFDGIAAAAGHSFGDMSVSGVVGAFPFEYGADNFPTTDSAKRRSANKWLYAAQLVGKYQIRHDLGLKLGGAYYHFTNVQGAPSDPCQSYLTGAQCSTDQSRPALLQKGNTVFALRNIVGPPGQASFSDRQFVGLTFDYHILDVNSDFTVRLNDKKAVTIGGDYIKNLAFDRNAVCKAFAGFNGAPATSFGGIASPFQGPINNVVAISGCTAARSKADFTGGDTAWTGRVSVGYPSPKKQGEWNVFAAYKYIQSDAVLDSLVDNDFHLGGTNAKGYVIAGTYGLYDGVTTRVKYQSANQITGPQLGIDVLQLDFLVAF